MRRGNKLYWTKRRCLSNALNYSSRGAWIKACIGAYGSARKNGWLDECCAHMPRLKAEKVSWTKKQCKEIAALYPTRTKWAQNHVSYRYAVNKGWLRDCVRHMPPVRKAMSMTECKREAKKFSSRKEWRTLSPRSYRSAGDRGLLNDLFKNDKWYRRYYARWSQEQLVQSAQRFQTRVEWFLGNNSTYAVAKQKGCFEKCCKHMKKWSRKEKRYV